MIERNSLAKIITSANLPLGRESTMIILTFVLSLDINLHPTVQQQAEYVLKEISDPDFTELTPTDKKVIQGFLTNLIQQLILAERIN